MNFLQTLFSLMLINCTLKCAFKFRKTCALCPYKSTYVSFFATSVTSEKTVSSDPFRDLVKELRRTNSPKKLLQLSQKLSADGLLDQNQTVFIFRTLQRMNRTDLSFEVLDLWDKAVGNNDVDIESASSLLKILCRLKRLDLAEFVIKKAQITIGDYSGQIAPYESLIKIKAEVLLPDLALGYAYNGSFQKTLNILDHIRANSIIINNDLSKNILREFIHETDSRLIRKALRSLVLAGGLEDNESIQILTSVFMKKIEFIKGVVSMDTMLPESACEVAFMGRSNVGKSSLINMLANRKNLAFTSKTPGKTSEFNYFDATGLITKSKEKHRFFLVDMPGVGYAQVMKSQRISWINLLNSYTKSRGTLRVLFHLVDSRHGLLDADKECLSLLQDLPSNILYVIVLTKADKRGGGVKQYIIDKIKTEINSRCTDSSRIVPIVLTSSETREGGSLLWSIILDAVAGDPPESFESLLAATARNALDSLPILAPENLNIS